MRRHVGAEGVRLASRWRRWSYAVNGDSGMLRIRAGDQRCG